MVYSAWSHWSINPHGVSFSLFKKRPHHRCFPVITQNIFNTTSSQDTSMWLLLNCFKVNHKHTIVTSKVFLDNFEQKSTQNSSKMRHFTVCTPPPPLSFCWEGRKREGGERGLNLTPNFQKGGALQNLNFERGIAGKKGVTLFRGVAIFTKK